ncbi:progestin and adipoQ receptor family member 3-like [Limulus polyphemus]|uniref:Progestin and adipoQ receptor family member 3-like n=1 Tax=Limulus polyphemus TaxID=6850 RepID=A0ABM1BWT5_LIMPO|nr:progestin and adipoQ receptor family member 3-like [Limulus polyphemus]
MYLYDQAPDYLKHNPFIHSGYRVYLSTQECARSLLWWSNETLNIWSHIIGFVFFLGLLIYNSLVVIPQLHPFFEDAFINTCVIISFLVTTFFSVIYHTFGCCSESAYAKWLHWDLAGITATLAAIVTSGVHYGFHCFPEMKVFYLSIIGLLTAGALILHFHSYFQTNTFHYLRVSLFVLWAVFGVVPTFHCFHLYGGYDNPIMQTLLPRIGVMYLLCGTGFAFYITRFPECCFPGRVDFVGSSHQVWHVLIIAAMYWWYLTGTAFVHLRSLNTCSHEMFAQIYSTDIFAIRS